MQEKKVKLMVFPELCLTGYDCRDLFHQELLLQSSLRELFILARHTSTVDALIFVGLPLEHDGKLYNVAAVLNKGNILGFVPKVHLPNYHEFYEAREFTAWNKKENETVTIVDHEKGKTYIVPFGTKLLFKADVMPHLIVAAELCEDLWVPCPPSISHTKAGATVIVNLSASNETVGKSDYRKSLVSMQSASLICAYLYASAGPDDSTTDLVFGGHDLIAENGKVLAESSRFANNIITTEIDVDGLISERRRMTTYPETDSEAYETVPFSITFEETKLSRFIDPHPFVPLNSAKRAERSAEILQIQTMGLVKRIRHSHAKTAVIGISGGLDSTLALLVAVRAMDILEYDRKNVIAVTMPGFGTTDRTYQNAVSLINNLGATLKEISIVSAVLQHFKDIGHNESIHDTTYENSQARERTMLLMDIANKENGLVIGTGDLSELALGWATYNGDHMSMYAVNASVPKTLVRFVIDYVAEQDLGNRNEILSDILKDILDTPVSPELLPPTEDGEIEQKTEDLVGPYELHDFFLYDVLRFGYAPRKILRLAKIAFQSDDPENSIYDKTTILHWLKNFYRRFFQQQFKRSCLPDGPKVGSAAVSPRGDLRMPSDASAEVWIRDLEEI